MVKLRERVSAYVYGEGETDLAAVVLDQCRSAGLKLAVAESCTGGLLGEPSSPTIELWMSFIENPTAGSWYRSHNASIVAAYEPAM